ncbi:hypothetical protein [Virgisporangium aurantiacum]|uniref:Uncharacterized protein n=1 Tax=Virgisporangium aurantiacum TaxID=175570 RepID=A0A8J4DZE2_9ACTN|nr:hypothetical protein [Virgisporangium aurantiacum]GIJ55438.1 hypothetical protein Vau01_029540 [Virgisporangium aurantiacum]
MSDVLARRYLAVMRAYPEGYRRERGEEILATLMERAGHRRWPPAREVLGLLSGALQARLSPGGPVVRAWAGGLRVAVLVLLALELAEHAVRLTDAYPRGRINLVLLACGLVAFHAVLRGRGVVAVLATVGWQAAVIRAGHWSPALAVATVLLLALIAVGLRERPAALSAGWWSMVPAATLVLHWPELSWPELAWVGSMNGWDYRQAVTITVIALLAVATLLDTRAAFVAAGLAVWQSVQEVLLITWAGDNPANTIFTDLYVTTWGVVAALLAVALLLGGHLLARRRASLV